MAATPRARCARSKKLDDLLHELQNQRVHMAIVIDEYGSVSGLVTIEDLVEEIIGDIQDEYDREEREYEQVSPSEYIIAAKMNIDDLNELLGTELEAGEEYDTVGGLMLAMLDKIPVVGDVVRTPEMTLTVLATRGRRITKLQVMLTHPDQRDNPDDADAEAPLPQHKVRNGVEAIPEATDTPTQRRDKNELEEDDPPLFAPKREATGSTASLARAHGGRRRARRH
jgi:putative hemolysin